jgi:hypothetical protein
MKSFRGLQIWAFVMATVQLCTNYSVIVAVICVPSEVVAFSVLNDHISGTSLRFGNKFNVCKSHSQKNIDAYITTSILIQMWQLRFFFSSFIYALASEKIAL